MTETTNDGAGWTLRGSPGERRRPKPSVPAQRMSGRAEVHEVLVGSDDAALDRVVAAAREAQATGSVLRLRAAREAGLPGGASVARERLAHGLELAAEVARALCPGLEVEVTGLEDTDC